MAWEDEVIAMGMGPPSNTVDPQYGGRTPFGIHDRLIPGMKTTWDWSKGARGGRWNSVDPGRTATAVNGVIAPVSGDVNNYKVEVRKMEVWFRRSTGWVRAFTTDGRDAALIFGSYGLVGSFQHDGGMTEEVGPAGGCAFRLRNGRFSHFYCRSNGSMSSRPTLPRDFQRLHVRGQFRLFGPAATTAVVVGRIGADYFITADQSAEFNDTKPSVAIFKHRRITQTWRWFGLTTMYRSEIEAGNGPPEPGAYVEPPDPEEPEEPEEPPDPPDDAEEPPTGQDPITRPPVFIVQEPPPPDPRRDVISRFGRRCRNVEAELPVEGA